MKTILYFLAICSVVFLLSCGGKSNNPTPTPANPNTGGTPGTSLIIKNIIVDDINITYTNNFPGTFEFTNNAGTDIMLAVNPGGSLLALTNNGNGVASTSNVTSNGLSVTYSNILKLTDDRANIDTTAMKFPYNYVYVKIPVDKATYGYDELDAYLDNDGYTNAGLINISGTTTPVTTTDIPGIFNNTKVVVTSSNIQ